MIIIHYFIIWSCFKPVVVLVVSLSSLDALLNLERLVCGYLYLSPVITMFSSPRNVPCPSEFSQAVVKVRLECSLC